MGEVDLSKYVPDFEIRLDVNEQKLFEIKNSTVNVQINEKFSSSSQFTLVIADELDLKSQTLKWLDSGIFLPEREVIKIKMGYVGNLAEMMIGKIKNFSTSGFSSDIPQITLSGYDNSYFVLTEKSDELSKKTTLDEIVKKIADDADLKSEVDKTTKYRDIITKETGISYYDFLKNEAKRIGYEFFVSRNKLYFINPRKNVDPSHTFTWKKDLIQFQPVINTSELVTKVIVRGTPPDSKKKIVQSAKVGEEDAIDDGMKPSELAQKIKNKDAVKKIDNRTVNSKEEAKDLARAELNRIGDNLITGSCSAVGNVDLQPGQIVELKNVGKLFSGKYLVTEVNHAIGSSGYLTGFNVRRNVIKGY